MIVRIAFALFTTFGSVALAWTLLNPHEDAHATAIVELATATYPWGLVQDGTHIWVAEPGCDLAPTCATIMTGTIGEYFMAHPTYGKKEFTEPAGFSSPAFVALDGKGNLWFTEPTTDSIGELTPKTGTGSSGRSPPLMLLHLIWYLIITGISGLLKPTATISASSTLQPILL
jgi:hypothetical protein